MSQHRSVSRIFSVAEIVASTAKPAALICAEKELSAAKQRIGELDAEKTGLWPIVNRVGPANWDISAERHHASQMRHDQLIREIAVLSARCVEIQRIIDRERPGYLAALASALAARRRADAESLIAGLEQIEAAFRSLREANAVVTQNGGKPLKLFQAPMLSGIRETADAIMTLSITSKAA